MKIRIIVPMAGTDPETGEPFSWGGDDIVDVPDDTAVALCTLPEDAPRAAYVDQPAKRERRPARAARGVETRG